MNGKEVNTSGYICTIYTVSCIYCLQGRPHPRLARGETYSCGYKPYRCELCKYSTTTKGNLSIHMQSDKHLHAVQEMPSIASATGFTDLSNASVITTEFDHENILQCLICSSYSTDNFTNMIKHIVCKVVSCNSKVAFSNSSLIDNKVSQSHSEKDRSRPIIGDIAVLHGVYHCNLCPYSTNLKANFQLHTRTDKHLQRVQMVSCLAVIT
uniref:C2H2-type domain-containing protein n=1 Tax=Syphacia muris TaxID=451379 RepID=A0A0N5ASP5_9BILA